MISHRKRSVWCFLFVTLFNLQGTRRFRRNIVIIHDFIPFVKNFFRKFLTFLPVHRCTQQLFYCITLSSVCQEVFQLFSFARLPLISDNFWIVTHCLVLVNSFLNFFKFLLAAPRISRTAWLEYQTFPHLSTPFFKFLKKMTGHPDSSSTACHFYILLYVSVRSHQKSARSPETEAP